MSLLVLLAIQVLAPSEWKTWYATDYRAALDSLLEGRPFIDSIGRPTVRYAPLFPMLLYGEAVLADTFGWSRQIVGAIVGAICIAVSATLLVQLVRRFVPVRIAWLAGFSVLLLPHLIWAWLRNLSVVPFLPLLMLSIVLVLRAIERRSSHPLWLFVAGVLLGLATLVRPIALYLPLVLTPALIWGSQFVAIGIATRNETPRPTRRARVLAPLLFLVGMTVALLPWELWMFRHTGSVIPVTSGGINSLRDGISLNNKSFREPLPLNPRLTKLLERIGAEYDSFDSPRALLTFLIGEARRDPLAVFQLYGLKVLRSWYGLDSQDRARERWLRWLALLYVLPTFCSLWVLGAGFRGRNQWSHEARVAWCTGCCVAGVTLYFWGMTTLAATIVRYMIPAFVLLPLLWACAWFLRPPRRAATGG